MFFFSTNRSFSKRSTGFHLEKRFEKKNRSSFSPPPPPTAPHHWWIPKTSLAAAESHRRWCPRLLEHRWSHVEAHFAGLVNWRFFFWGGGQIFCILHPFCWQWIHMYVIYVYMYTNMDLSGRSPRSTLHVFQHSCTRHWKSPCLSSYPLFVLTFSPMVPSGESKGWMTSPDSLDSYGMNLLMAGHSSLDDSKRKITGSARIGFNLSPNPSTFFKSDDPSLVFMGASIILHQLTWQINVQRIPFSQWSVLETIASGLTDTNSKTNNHIMEHPPKHWGGLSKFHPPKHWRTSGVVHHQIRLKPQNHKIPLNSACEVVEHGICINLSTRFLCQHNLHHL